MSEMNNYNCPSCGIEFGFPVKIEKLWRENHKSFFCPNGHSLSWGEATQQDKKILDFSNEILELKSKLASALEELDKQTKRANELALELEIYKPVQEKEVA